MDAQSQNLIVSGIEPVDELMGGLRSGQLYLVHGEASGKSLFGIKFLIEGLKHNQNCALVIRYSPEDAVRRFARLGYDCLEDVYSGRLVILEYSDDISQKVGKLRELAPVLRELEWLLGETQPKRLVFDPVTSVLSGTEGSIEARTKEFAGWARSFGATVVLTANETNQEVIQSFEPQVVESFRFDIRELGDRSGRFLVFEKSLSIADQAIEVDPSRGVFLLGRAAEEVVPYPPSTTELNLIREELRSAREGAHWQGAGPLEEIDLVGESASEPGRLQRARDTGELIADAERQNSLQTHRLSPLEERELQSREPAKFPDSNQIDYLRVSFEERPAPLESGRPLPEGQVDELSNLLDDLTGSATPLDLDIVDLPAQRDEAQKQNASPAGSAAFDREDLIRSGETQAPSSLGRRDAEVAKPSQPRHARASDLRIDSALAARAAELLLRPPGASAELPTPEADLPRAPELREPSGEQTEGEVRAQDFSVLIIQDDAETSEVVVKTLSDYTLEVVHDGVSGLARLIHFKPDLIILDFDLPVIDGFKVLTLIRSSMNVPIIIISGSRMRALDRVMASELGADYYLTKPFSAKELKYKARQLIARYRGISSWIVRAHPSSQATSSALDAKPAAAGEPARGQFTPYREFAEDVEKRVKAALDGGAPFSIVGCRLPRMTADGGRVALHLFDIVRSLVREADVMSTNSRNDLVVLLADAGNAGARAFAGRLRERVIEEMNQEPSLWMRSFPELEESTEAITPIPAQSPERSLSRRAGDKPEAHHHGGDKPSEPARSDPRESYIDFLERL